MLITQTPLRISFAGGGTDFPAYFRRQGGGVVSSAIDKFIYVILNQRFDDMIYLSYSKKEIVSSVDDIHHELVREAMRMAGVKKGVEIAIMADIPSEGSGLGSSSSLTVGLLNAFYAYRGVQITAEQLAREACQIEIERCGKPIGIQDQYIAAYGGMRSFTFQPDDRVVVDDLSCGRTRQELSFRLLLFYTNKTRQADTILREQNARTELNVAALDVLRQQALDCRSFMERGELDRMGDLMAENWRIKKKLASTISNPDLDRMVETAHAGGATGCKICGAGGGGFLLVYCRPEKQDALRHAMAGYRDMPFFLERSGSKVIFNVEGYEWK